MASAPLASTSFHLDVQNDKFMLQCAQKTIVRKEKSRENEKHATNSEQKRKQTNKHDQKYKAPPPKIFLNDKLAWDTNFLRLLLGIEESSCMYCGSSVTERPTLWCRICFFVLCFQCRAFGLCTRYELLVEALASA